MRLLSSLIALSVINATSAGNHTKAKAHKHREQKLENALMKEKSLESLWPWYPSTQRDTDNSRVRIIGPKHKGELCDTLTSTVLLFDTDGSGGLDWDEFQLYNTAIVDVAKDHGAEETTKLHLGKNETEDLDKVYHDITCECYYIFGRSRGCCRDESPKNDGLGNIDAVQVRLEGLNEVKGDTVSFEDKQYRNNFCNGILYLLESEGVDLKAANEAILSGLNVDLADFEGATESSNMVETGNDSFNESLNEGAGSTSTSSESIANETPKQLDATTSSIMTASGSEDETTDTNTSSVSTGAIIGILIAVLAALIATVMTIIHRKQDEKRRLAEFAGEELIDDDVEANSLHNDIVAMETMGDEKVYTKSHPEVATVENDQDGSSVVSSIVSETHNEEYTQISFENDEAGRGEAKVTVGSTLAAMGVASTVTSRLSSPQHQKEENEEQQLPFTDA